MLEPLLTAVYTGEPDVVFEFRREGEQRLFGRDDLACDIVIWSAINAANLSRVAGRIWRMEDELWLRNLSQHHELHLRLPGMPQEQPLRPRRSGQVRGEARSVPAPLCTVSGPDGCEVQIRQIRQPAADVLDFGLPLPTLSAVPDVPGPMRPVAAALCEPLLLGGYLPASYREVMTRLAEPSMKTVRRRVAELCQFYADASPALHRRVVERLTLQQQRLGTPEDPRLRHGIWSFGQPAGPADDRLSRRRALALPEYYEVARMLVSHFRVTAADVAAQLPPRTDDSPGPAPGAAPDADLDPDPDHGAGPGTGPGTGPGRRPARGGRLGGESR